MADSRQAAGRRCVAAARGSRRPSGDAGPRTFSESAGLRHFADRSAGTRREPGRSHHLRRPRSEGVRAALAFLERNQPGEPVGAIGVSLGAASLVLAKPDPAPSAVVLESMYPTIEEAVSNRLRIYLGDYAANLALLLVEQLPLRLGIAPAQLHPIEQTGALHCPVLIISGSADRHTPLAETQRIFAATSSPKELWIVDGAAHVDLHAFAPAAYETKVA